MPATLAQKAKRLRARAKTLRDQASIIEQTMAEQAFEASPYKIGEVVEGLTWVGRVKPTWVVGTITHVWWGSGVCCVTLRFPHPVNRERRGAYFLTSIRAIGTNPCLGV